MGLFDFLKKKEFEEIRNLKEQVERLSKYQAIVDTEKAIAERLKAFEDEKDAISKEITELKEESQRLKTKYIYAKSKYDDLQKEIAIYEEALEITDYGMYAPHFNFDTSEKYKEEIIKVRNEQTKMIKNSTAALGGGDIRFNGSLAQGQAIVRNIKKIMLRAFNGECDSFVANVDWKNITKMEERIAKSLKCINSAHSSQNIRISSTYERLKLDELRLAYEYQLKKHQEKEEQKAIREQMREEEKARKEIEAAMLKAQKEEETYQKALEKARKDVESAEGAKQEKLLNQIQELEARLQEAGENKERAMSMAQQTKRGFVYVISNIGSFGENVYKIGMTRRLDPMDRVKELGDASVPFPFDVHAIIFSEDAPRLENELHKEFAHKRLNLVNNRKEFFNVTLEEIEEIVLKNNASIEFTKIAEARDWRESKAIRNKKSDIPPMETITFPADPFGDDE